MKRILLVEDCSDDAELVREAFAPFKATIRLERTSSADEALNMLTARAARARGLLPTCILLDMMMEPHDGMWLLHEMGRRPELREIPVMVLSQHLAAVERARDFPNVIGSVSKPERIAEQRRLVQDIVRLTGAMKPKKATRKPTARV